MFQNHGLYRLLFALGGVFGPAAAARADSPVRPDAAADVYSKPDQLVDIGSARRLNLRCTGSGTPTVVLESGAISDSMAWFKVQPIVAGFARVCAYDRAGFGFSDGGPLPRNVDAAADDLHALIRSARIATPLILVGHSLGTNIVRRFADRHAADVAALVLVDPPPQHVAEFAPAWIKEDERESAEGIAYMRKCEQGAEKGQLDVPPPELDRCLRKPNPQYSATLNAALHTTKSHPTFWRTLISVEETSGKFLERPVSPKERHGVIPLLILAADSSNADAPPEVRKALDAAQEKTNRLIAATSTRGEIIPVAHSSHDVQMDRPDAVVDAIRKAIKRAAAK
jgi:pimeloyl-ACP methyl ester carboxylesterase